MTKLQISFAVGTKLPGAYRDMVRMPYILYLISLLRYILKVLVRERLSCSWMCVMSLWHKSASWRFLPAKPIIMVVMYILLMRGRTWGVSDEIKPSRQVDFHATSNEVWNMIPDPFTHYHTRPVYMMYEQEHNLVETNFNLSTSFLKMLVHYNISQFYSHFLIQNLLGA